MEIDFQKLLDQFKGNLVIIKLIDKIRVTPDEYLYHIETNDGKYYVYEVDLIDTFKETTDFIKREIGDYKFLVEVKQPTEQFEDTNPYKVSGIYKQPKDYDEIKKYANDKYGSFKGYFNFLIKV